MDNIQEYSTANGYALRTTTTDFDVETLPIQKQRYGPVLFVFIECTERGARLKRYSLETISMDAAGGDVVVSVGSGNRRSLLD